MICVSYVLISFAVKTSWDENASCECLGACNNTIFNPSKSYFHLSPASFGNAEQFPVSLQKELQHAIDISQRTDSKVMTDFMSRIFNLTNYIDKMDQFYHLNVIDLSTSVLQRISQALEQFMYQAYKDMEQFNLNVSELRFRYEEILRPQLVGFSATLDIIIHNVDLACANLIHSYNRPLAATHAESLAKRLNKTSSDIREEVLKLVNFNAEIDEDLTILATNLFETNNLVIPYIKIPTWTIIDKAQRSSCKANIVHVIKLLLCISQDLKTYTTQNCQYSNCFSCPVVKTNYEDLKPDTILENNMKNISNYCMESVSYRDDDKVYYRSPDFQMLFKMLAELRETAKVLDTACLHVYDDFLMQLETFITETKDTIHKGFDQTNDFRVGAELNDIKNVHQILTGIVEDYTKSGAPKIQVLEQAQHHVDHLITLTSNLNLKMEQQVISPLLKYIEESKGVLITRYLTYVSLTSKLELYYPEESDHIIQAVMEAKLWCEPFPRLQSHVMIDYASLDVPCGRTLIWSGLSAFLRTQAQDSVSFSISNYMDSLVDEINILTKMVNEFETGLQTARQELIAVNHQHQSEFQIDGTFVRYKPIIY